MLERIVLAAVTLLLVVVGFFFLAAALVAGAIIAAAALLRLWWIRRRLGPAGDAGVITAEYTVIEREALPADRPADGVAEPGPDEPRGGPGATPAR